MLYGLHLRVHAAVRVRHTPCWHLVPENLAREFGSKNEPH